METRTYCEYLRIMELQAFCQNPSIAKEIQYWQQIKDEANDTNDTKAFDYAEANLAYYQAMLRKEY